MAPLKVGDTLPADIELPDAEGRPVRLADYRDDKNVVLYFYPADSTPGCTKEACAFRDAYEVFSDLGAEVIGVSSDGSGSHRSFRDRHGLPFVLLTDKGGDVRRRLGVKNSLGLIPGRETFIVDKRGVVRHRFRSQSQATRHVDEALEVLRGLED